MILYVSYLSVIHKSNAATGKLRLKVLETIWLRTLFECLRELAQVQPFYFSYSFTKPELTTYSLNESLCAIPSQSCWCSKGSLAWYLVEYTESTLEIMCTMVKVPFIYFLRWLFFIVLDFSHFRKQLGFWMQIFFRFENCQKILCLRLCFCNIILI